MTAENNIKYIAEEWINSQEEEDFKVRVLQALIKQWQGHTVDGSKFNADMVDGMHWEEVVPGEEDRDYPPYIKTYIDDQLEDVMRSFSIGYTFFSSECQEYLLGFDAIRLYNEDDDHEGDDQPYNTLPWDSKPRTGSNIPTLWQVFQELFLLTYLGNDEDLADKKTNRDIYLAFKEEFYAVERRLKDLEDALRGKIIDGKLNADMVSGLRFYIYTPEQYKAMQDKAALYKPNGPNTDDVINNYKKLNSIHNIFIIKTRQELLDNGYPGEYDFNPDNNIIDKYYHFRVAEATVDGVTELWLQYKHDDAVQWENLCRAADFIDYGKVKEVTYSLLKNENNYELNQTPFYNALKKVTITDSSDLPIATYNRGKFLVGGFYTNTGNRTILPVETINNFKYLNLNGMQTFLETKISGVQNQLDTYKTSNDARVLKTENDIDTNKTNISNIRGNDRTSSLETLKKNIDDIQTQFNNYKNEINQKISDLIAEDWQSKDIRVLDNTYGNKSYVTTTQYNRTLKLAMLRFNIVHYHHGANSNIWVSPIRDKTISSNQEYNYYNKSNSKTPALPIGTVIAEVSAKDGDNKNLSNFYLSILSDGNILIRGTPTKNTLSIISGTILYKYNHKTSEELK